MRFRFENCKFWLPHRIVFERLRTNFLSRWVPSYVLVFCKFPIGRDSNICVQTLETWLHQAVLLVRPQASPVLAPTQSWLIRFFTNFRDLWYLIGTCLVFRWYPGLLVNLIAPWLSAKISVGGATVLRKPSSSTVSRIPNSPNRPQIHTASHAASVWAIYSASQVDVETVGCFRLAQEIGPSLRIKR